MRKNKKKQSLALMNLMAKECLDLIVHSLDRTKFLHTDFFFGVTGDPRIVRVS